MELTFKERISFEETIQMINDVSNSVFDTDSETNTTVYIPELYDYALGLSYAKYYGGYISENNSEYDYTVAMDYLGEVQNTVNPQLVGIKNSINAKIELKKAEIIKSDINIISKFDELVKPFTELLNIVSEKIEKIDTKGLNRQLRKFNVKNLIDQYFSIKHEEDKGHKTLEAKDKEIFELRQKLNKLTSENEVSDNIIGIDTNKDKL